jgi:hypothetical protein
VKADDALIRPFARTFAATTSIRILRYWSGMIGAIAVFSDIVRIRSLTLKWNFSAARSPAQMLAGSYSRLGATFRAFRAFPFLGVSLRTVATFAFSDGCWDVRGSIGTLSFPPFLTGESVGGSEACRSSAGPMPADCDACNPSSKPFPIGSRWPFASNHSRIGTSL